MGMHWSLIQFDWILGMLCPRLMPRNCLRSRLVVLESAILYVWLLTPPPPPPQHFIGLNISILKISDHTYTPLIYYMKPVERPLYLIISKICLAEIFVHHLLVKMTFINNVCFFKKVTMVKRSQSRLYLTHIFKE